MKRYFTADLHLGSSTILEYAHRPFTSAEDALAAHLCSINGNLTSHDVLIHVGDFMLSGADRHGKVEDIGLKWSQDDYLDMLNCNVILLDGNHDGDHNCECAAKNLWIDLNQNWKSVFVSHFPSSHHLYRGPVGKEGNPKVVLCGHVHDSWLSYWDDAKKVMNINVGCDVWDYRPVRDAELTEMLDYMWNGKIQAPDKMTRKEFEAWRAANEKFVETERIFKKQARYAKKGLTPEICQMRKEEALRKKGLL